nr:hypothetical protein [Tanacetum cinerariifolium]
GGTGTALSAGIIISSAYAHTGKPAYATVSPTLHVVTPGPIAITVPAASIPSI